MAQVRIACKGALDKVWDSVEALDAEYETQAAQMTNVVSHVNSVEVDLQDMQQHTKKLDTYINDMLKEMLGTLNQGKPSPLLSQPPTALCCPHPSCASHLPQGLAQEITNACCLDDTAIF